jgi:hypothetical protein
MQMGLKKQRQQWENTVGVATMNLFVWKFIIEEQRRDGADFENISS